MIYLRITDRQTVKYYSTNQTLDRADLFRFEQTINDGNIFEIFRFFQLNDIALNIPAKSSTDAQVFTCICYFFKASKRRYTSSNATTDVLFPVEMTSVGAFQNVLDITLLR